jgi:hypothetical protein
MNETNTVGNNPKMGSIETTPGYTRTQLASEFAKTGVAGMRIVANTIRN